LPTLPDGFGTRRIVLILIVLILLAGNWFCSEWKGISLQKEQATEIKVQIVGARKKLEKLLEKVEKHGEEARKKMEEPNSVEKVSAAAWAEEAQAKKEYDDACSQVGWYQNLFDQRKVVLRTKAWASEPVGFFHGACLSPAWPPVSI
jgi:hypothetical protein